MSANASEDGKASVAKQEGKLQLPPISRVSGLQLSMSSIPRLDYSQSMRDLNSGIALPRPHQFVYSLSSGSRVAQNDAYENEEDA